MMPATTWLRVVDPAGPRTPEQVDALLAAWSTPERDPNVLWTPWGSCPKEVA